MSNNVLEQLIHYFQLELTDQDCFRGQSQDLGYPRVFGGQVLGQSLVAAGRTVENRQPHSLHAYFLRPGDPVQPIDYRVSRIRDGKSFTTRSIVAEQNSKAIFNMSVSYQTEEKGLEHQDQMPDVPGPEGLVSELERARKYQDYLPESIRYKLTCERPVEIRVVKPVDYFNPVVRDPINYAWIKTTYPLPDDDLMHRCLLAYVSDFGLIEPSMFPHGLTFAQKNMQVASLDHSMWFHHPFRVDEWLLYEMNSPVSSSGRGLNFGRFFNQKGTLVASTAQEGLIRQRQ